jgi:methionyl-tRNA formyltransferase
MARVRRFMAQSRRHGISLSALNVLGMGRGGDARERVLEAAFKQSMEGYGFIPAGLIRADCEVRDIRQHDFVRSLRPDVTICLGGPLYPKEFIDASPLTLNFHSGISPIYNGSASIAFAFANGHPHLCGGTLMRMSTDVDGGDVLGHYLPAVVAGDSPESLFAKTVQGAALMYCRILEQLGAGRNEVEGIPQPRPLFYTRAFDYGWYHRAKIARHMALDTARTFQRAERVIEYWREPTASAAKAAFIATLNTLLWDHA